MGQFERVAVQQSGNEDAIGNLISSLSPQDWQNQRSAQRNQQGIILHDNLPHAQAEPGAPSVVVVDKTHHRTHVLQMQNGKLEDVLTVPDSVGKKSTPTPEGRMVITQKELDPVWIPPKSIDPHQHPVQPYKVTHHNPIGVAFLRLNGGSIGLHGTNRPDQIGFSVSHGCVRHNNDDILKIAHIVDKGTPVYIVKDFDGTVVRANDFNRR